MPAELVIKFKGGNRKVAVREGFPGSTFSTPSCDDRTLLLHMLMRRSACTFAIGNLVGGGGPSA
jgi:hypothetical protein